MVDARRAAFDQIGYWSEVKLDILREYAAAYSKILSAQPFLKHVYIDAFAGAGVHVRKATGEPVPGSPLNALNVSPPFREYHLIDIDSKKTSYLRKLIGSRKDVFLHKGDANTVLLEQVLPRVKYRDYRRGLCILDPYGLHLNWEVMFTAGQMKTIDVFLNFPVEDINRNVLWRHPEKAPAAQVERLTAFWGDESWRQIAYTEQAGIFGTYLEKEPNKVVAEGFRERLRSVAGFARVPEPMPMRNSKGAVVYYLFFASQKVAAENIALDIFKKYRMRGAP